MPGNRIALKGIQLEFDIPDLDSKQRAFETRLNLRLNSIENQLREITKLMVLTQAEINAKLETVRSVVENYRGEVIARISAVVDSIRESSANEATQVSAIQAMLSDLKAQLEALGLQDQLTFNVDDLLGLVNGLGTETSEVITRLDEAVSGISAIVPDVPTE